MSFMSALGGLTAGFGLKAASDYAKGAISNYYAEKRARDQAALEYAYAERYAKNAPTWNVEGLRSAGLNPVLAASNGVSTSAWSPSSPATPDTKGDFSMDDMLKFKQGKQLDKQTELLDAEIKGQKIRNINDAENRGLDGKWGAISRLISESEKRTPELVSYLKNSPLFTIEKKADSNNESYSDDERKALRFYEILQSHGYNDVESREQGGDQFWEHLESAWAKDRRNVRRSRSR